MSNNFRVKKLTHFNSNGIPECHYIYTEEEEKESKRKNAHNPSIPIRMAGENCRTTVIANNPDLKTYGYCFPHQRKLKLADPVKVAELIGKQKKAWADRKNKEEAEKKIGEGGGKYSSKEAKQRAFEKLYHDIVQDENFRLRDVLNAMIKPTMTDSAMEEIKKDLFALWYTREVVSRQPKTLAEVGKILQVSEAMLLVWITESWFTNSINEIRFRNFVMLSPHIDRKMCIQSMMGNEMSIQQFYRQVGVIAASTGKMFNLLDDLPEELEDKAIEMSNLEDNPSHTIKLSKEENELFKELEE